ncbi:MAG: GtrA family protein [Candidatus Gracilibacteria bacterium]|nr:GtrA family protein [Candidatus Gracilibacteria bacterium]
MKTKVKKLLKSKIVKYIVGGGLAALIDLYALYIFVDKFSLYYIYSALLAFCISFTFGFFFQKYITFSNYDKKHLKQGFIFLVFQLIGLGLNIVLLYVFVDLFDFYYMYVAIFNKFIIFVWNYIMNNYFNFK